MPPFLIALVIVVGGLWLIRKSARMNPKDLSNFAQKLAGGGAIAAAGLLFLRGQTTIATTLFAIGAGLYGKSSLFPNGFNLGSIKTPEQNGSENPKPRKPLAPFSKNEAYDLLGLKPGATEDEIKSAHKRLMKDFHPDKGGTDYLAAKINQAKDVLLG
jgi:DnaJ-domain-containing protein 1